MRLQSTQFSCGPIAIANALRAAGLGEFGEDGVAELARTSPVRGTQVAGVRRALRKLGLNETKFQTPNARSAWAALRGYLHDGHPVLLVVDDGEHWVAAIGSVGGRVLLADGADGRLVISMSYDELAMRWHERGMFLGVAVLGQRA